jgi:hypothetical protein
MTYISFPKHNQPKQKGINVSNKLCQESTYICLVTSELSWFLQQVAQERMVPEQEQSYGSAQKKLKIFWKHLPRQYLLLQ